jgi:orotate phosphoribosyltransferase-like protein
MPPKTSSTLIDEARTLEARGLSRKEIAQLLGISTENLRVHLGPSQKPRKERCVPQPPKLTEDAKARALVLLRDEGWPRKEVAAELGVHVQTLRKYVPGYGLSRQELGRIGAATARANRVLKRSA